MINTAFILSKLPMYTGTVEVIADDQSVYDIIRGVKTIHKRYADDYDKIAKYFIGATGEDTCRNIFNFLRRSSFYYVEGEDLQTLRSPSAILATGKVHGIDCKNYALFAGGILDAVNRSGLQEIPFCYRFASDKLFDPTPCHVFIVAYPGTSDEMWIDPIPQVSYFDERLTYYYHTDKNYKSMSLQILSGRSVGFSATDGIDIVASAASGNWTAAAGKAISSIFSKGGPNPNDWQGWHPDGSDARYWTIHDGTGPGDPPNEAVNILSYIKAHGLNTMLVSGAGVPAVTPQQIADKISRVGYPQEAANFLAQVNSGSLSTGTVPGQPLTPGTTQASTNKLLTYGLIGAGILFVVNQKKRVSGKNDTYLLLGAAVAAYFVFKKKPLIDVKADITREYGLTNPKDIAFLDTVPEQTLRDIDSGKISVTSIAS